MDGRNELTAALQLLGEVLEKNGQHFDLAIVGGAALLLRGVITRSTMDMDAVALVDGDKWNSSKPLPKALTAAIRDVAETLDLPREPRDEKDWFNCGPSMLLQTGLPHGFEKRATIRRFGGLTLRIASRIDLIHLKLWSATDSNRGSRRSVNIDDLLKLSPSKIELLRALRWCAQKDGRPDFIAVEAAGVIGRLGFTIEELFNE